MRDKNHRWQNLEDAKRCQYHAGYWRRKDLTMCCMVGLGGLPLHWVAAGAAGGMILAERQPVLQVSEGSSKVGVAPGPHHCLHQQDCLQCLLTK